MDGLGWVSTMSKAPASSLDWSERHPASVIDLLHSHGWGWLASYLYMLRWDMGCFILLQDTPPGYLSTSVNIYPGGVSVNSAARLFSCHLAPVGNAPAPAHSGFSRRACSRRLTKGKLYFCVSFPFRIVCPRLRVIKYYH